MCKLKNQSEEVFVLAFGYARYAFQRYRNDVYRLLPRAEAKRYIGHGAPSQKLFFTDNREAHRIFREAEYLKVSDDGELILVQKGSVCRGYLFKPAVNKYEQAFEETTSYCEFYCGGGVIVLGFETYKTVLYRGKENKLYELSDHFLTVEISSEDKVFVTNAANKSSVYFYDRGMKQVVILG